MIELSSPDIALTLDPAHGAEILALVDVHSGRQLLGRPPWDPLPPRGGDLDETAWISRYRGGWQLAAPNAGNACSVGADHHGFHGRASVDPWQLEDRDSRHAVLRWVGHGLELTRSVKVDGPSVEVRLSWMAAAAAEHPAPLVAVEHICFGRELLDPVVEVVANARGHELSERDGPLRAPADAAIWPQSRLLGGEVEIAGRWSLSVARARFSALTGFAEGRAEVRNAETGLGVRLEWDDTVLPAAWLWHEVRATGGIWGRRAELLAFEPASVPHSLGLADAVLAKQALWASPGERGGYWVRITVLHP